MAQESRRKAGAFGTHSVKIGGITTGNEVGHSAVNDFFSDTISKNSSIGNDITSGTTIGSGSPVKHDVHDNSSKGSASFKNLDIYNKGSGWVNKP